MAEREHELSADDIEQAGRLLMPHFQNGVRKELHALRDQLQEALTLHEDRVEQKLVKLAARVDALESLKAKAMIGWSAVVLAGTLGFNWFCRKLGVIE